MDPPPDVVTMLGAIDRGAQAAANEVRTLGVPVVRAALPVRSGRARRGTTGRVGRTGTGYRVTIAPSSRVRYPGGVTAREVVRWLHTGTGVYGRLGRPITPRRAKAFRLPNGWFSESVRGYRGRDFFGAAQASLNGLVYRTFETGAKRAARWAEDVL